MSGAAGQRAQELAETGKRSRLSINTTLAVARARARPPLTHACADTLRALAEASVRQPASAGLVAQLNPGHPRPVTLRMLEQLHETGLVTERPHPLTPLLGAYTLSPAGRAWVRRHG